MEKNRSIHGLSPCSFKMLRIMKLTVFLMLISFIGVFASETYSQTTKLSFKAEKISLEKFLIEIENQSEFRFFYTGKIDVEKEVSGEYKNKKITEILDDIKEETSIQYEIMGRQIILSPVNAGNTIKSIQQQKSISGKITDSSGSPLPGVTVFIVGTTQGTVTNPDGEYSLPDVPEGATVQFSFVGMKTQEIVVGSTSTINVTLVEDAIGLEEVVAIGYGTMKKRDITGSVATVKNDDIQSISTPSIGSALQGKATGVQIISSGVPGSDETIRIRGIGTIGNNSPLLVVDGIPTNGGLNQINMEDVASVDILKDASATAIYGSRGANGVIMLTTKNSDKGQGKFNFSFYTGVQDVVNVVPLLNAQEYAALSNDALSNNGRPTNPDWANPEAIGTGTDWQDALFQQGTTQNYFLSYSGGSEKSNYYTSIGYLNQDGVVMETGFERFTAKFNLDADPFDFIKVGTRINVAHDIKTRGDYSIRNAMVALPTQPILDEDGIYSGPGTPAEWYGDITNPIGRAELIENTTKGYNLLGTTFMEISILPELKFKTTLGTQTNFWDNTTWSPKYDWKPISQEFSSLNQSDNKSITWNWDNSITYENYFNDKHKLVVMLGTSAQENNTSFISGSVQDFASDLTQELGNGTYQPQVGGNSTAWSLMSYIGRVNYTFEDKYLFTATVRKDGSSRFGAGKKWGTFPSVALAWRISEEGFLKADETIDDLKLRIGYGATGNQMSSGLYDFSAELQTAEYNLNGQVVNAVFPYVMPNPNLQWESQVQSNIGIDITLLDQRLSVSTDFYSKKTKDMLVPMSVPLFTGYDDQNPPAVNAGSIRNSGVELSISSDNLKGELTWSTDFNISYNTNKVLALNDSVPIIGGLVRSTSWANRTVYGQPVNVFYGYVTDGIFQNQEEIDSHASQIPGNDPYNSTSPGDIRFKDLNDDGVIDEDDRDYLGNPSPKFIFAMNNTFSYKGFDLSIFLQGVSGNKIFNANRIWNEGMDLAQNQTKETLNRWSGEGTSNTMPRAVQNDPNKNTRISDRFIEDGSYLRLKDLILGYSLPSYVCQKVKLNHVRIYFSARNLYTITKYKGFDPEVPFNGIDNNVYPVSRTLSIGAKIGF